MWASAGNHGKNDIEWFEAWWNNEKLITALVIHIAYAPKEYKIQLSTDLKQWDTFKEFTSTHGGNWVHLAKHYWWWRWRYFRFITIEEFDDPKWVRGVKILFKTPVYFFFGLYRIEAITKIFPALLHSNSKSDEHECIVSSSSQRSNVPGDRLYMMNCLDALALYDGRELWEVNLGTGSIYRNHCWEVKDGDVSDNGILRLNSCHNDLGQKFTMTSDQKMRPLLDVKKCITAMGDNAIENAILNQMAKASTTLDDSEHKPERVVDGSDSYWGSGLGVTSASFEIIFHSAAVIKEIEIEWKYPALSFDISGLNEFHVWSTFYQKLHNNELLNKVDLGPRLVLAIKINMHRPHPTLGLLRDKSIFGIKRIKAASVFKAVKFKDCDFGDESKTNRWSLETMEDWDLNAGVIASQSKGTLTEKLNNLVPLITSLIDVSSPLAKIIDKGKEMRENVNRTIRDLKDLGIRLTMYENYLKELEPEAPDLPSMIGAGPLSPGKDCFIIKTSYSYKLSGFYWIKPDCAKSSLRVYCDFDNKNRLSYAFLGKFETNEHMDRIRDVSDIQLECAKVGYEPVEVKSKEQLQAILMYIASLNLDMNHGEVVPLAYDYTCRYGCKGTYQSLNSETSTYISSELKALKDNNNILNVASVSVHPDGAGVGMNQNKIFFFQFGEFPIKGIVCSTNFDGKSAAGLISADCFTMPRGNPSFDGSRDTSIKVYCRPECEKVLAAPVWGNMVYRDDSSICRAAIHSGVITSEKGGKVQVVLQPGRESYESVESFGVNSEISLEKAERSFIVNKYSERCPIENFPKSRRGTSFMQVAEKLKISDLNGAVVDNVNDDLILKSNEGEEEMNKAFLDIPKFDPRKLLRFKSNQDQAASTSSTASSSASSSSNSASSSSNSQTADTGANATGEEDEGGVDAGEASKPANNADAIKYIERIYKKTNSDVKSAIRFVKETEKLIEAVSSKLESISSTDISSVKLHIDSDALTSTISATQLILTRMAQRAMSKVARFERNLQLARLEKLKLQIYEPYVEDYYFWITDIYDIYDAADAQGRPSNWLFSTKSLGSGHLKSIAQTSNIRCLRNEPGCATSMLMLKYKQWHDAGITFSFMSQDSGTVGVVFRMRDPFNYYVFEIRQRPGYIRCRQVKKGVSFILGHIDNGGFKQGIWYRVYVTINHFEFAFSMGEESAGMAPNELPQLLKVEEQLISSGRFGFLVNSNSALFIDKFDVKPLECLKQSDVPDILYLPVECSRYKENYFSIFSIRYKVHDPKSYSNGPSEWKFEVDKGDRPKVIYQATKISSSNPDQVGTIAFLDMQKMFKDGFYQVEFYPKADGIVGFIFRYLNNDNYYTFEVGGMTKRFLSLKKKVDGRFVSLARENSKGYEIGKWYKVTMYIAGPTFKIKFHTSIEAEEDAFPSVDDDDIKEGKVGFSTFGVNTAFDNFRIMPLSDLDVEDGGEEDKGPIKDLPIKPLSKVEKEKLEFANNNDKKLSWSQCLTITEPELRSKDCLEKYEKMGSDSVKYCKDNYCEDCCNSIIGWIHSVQRLTCKKECSVTVEPTSNKREWTFCVDAPRPASSLYFYCDKSFEKKKVEAAFCKLDFCNLCCVSSQSIMNILSSDEALKDCHDACYSKYSDQKDVIF